MHDVLKSQFTVEVPIEYKGSKLVVLHNTLSEASAILQSNEWPAPSPDGLWQIEPSLREFLISQGFLKKRGTDEAAIFENWKQKHSHNSRIIKSKVLVTRNCNNGCPYCITPPESKTMSRKTMEAADRFWMQLVTEKHPAEVIDEYSGGEVLCNYKVVLESAMRRFYFCRGLGIVYHFTIITNGTLIERRLVERLIEVGLSGIRVSVAGPAAIHDRLRPSKDGMPTYEIIMNNLQSISGLAPITIECQYDSASFDHLALPEMMDDLAARSIAVETVRFGPILPTRTESPYQAGIGDINILIWLMSEAEKRGYPQYKDVPSCVCAADLRYHYVIDYDGRLIACPAQKADDVMSYGNVLEGIDFVAESHILKRSLPQRCLKECELLPLCMGGCRLQALTSHGNFNGIDCRHDMIRPLLDEYITQKAMAALESGGQAARVD